MWTRARCPSSAEPSLRRLRRWSLRSTKSSASTRAARSVSETSNKTKPNGPRRKAAAGDTTMKTELRFTDTNAASDSKGRTWGLEGGPFWWLVGGVGTGITLFFVLIVVLKVSLPASFAVALVPALLCVAYIFGLRQGKPPGYD